MAREIKFRAWLPDLKKMETGWFGLRSDGKASFNSECILMQFTGLTDKNGKEIYESDIVRWDDMSDGERWRVAKVKINPDIQFKIVRIVCDFIQSAQEGYVFRYGNFAYKNTEDHLEIIGNIYENPELLKK